MRCGGQDLGQKGIHEGKGLPVKNSSTVSFVHLGTLRAELGGGDERELACRGARARVFGVAAGAEGVGGEGIARRSRRA